MRKLANRVVNPPLGFLSLIFLSITVVGSIKLGYELCV